MWTAAVVSEVCRAVEEEPPTKLQKLVDVVDEVGLHGSGQQAADSYGTARKQL